MNKYQREKAKYMRKLATLGVGYSQSKSILRKYSFEEVDHMIEQIDKIKNSSILEKIVKAVGEIVSKILWTKVR